MQIQELKKNFSVALLMGDIHEAQSLSEILRKFGLYAHLYQNLDEYWVANKIEPADISIIDARLVSEADLHLKNHPENMAKRLCYYLYVPQEISLDLEGLHFHGLITTSLDLESQLTSAIERVNAEALAALRKEELEQRIKMMAKKNLEISKDSEELYQLEKNFELLESLSQKLSEQPYEQFSKKLAKVFSIWDACEAFTIYELNQTGQKIISPAFAFERYQPLPSLWLGKICHEGIEKFAQEMATEVAFDEFGTHDIKIVKIQGRQEKPDILIIGKFKLSELSLFPWQVLETEFSAKFARHLLNSKDFRVEGDQFIAFWDALSEMDDMDMNQVKATHKVFTLNLKNLVDMTVQMQTNRFQWKAFFTDYLCELGHIIAHHGKISVSSVQDIVLFIEQKEMERIVTRLKSFIQDFSYWKYFENSHVVMTKKMFPEMKMLAPSSINYLRNANAPVEMVKASQDRATAIQM